MEYTYSFIIPHHNSPELLNRCLDSIPQRGDIQVIVVDDNSFKDKRPNINRQDVEIVYIDAEHTKGAGHARNEGLARAKGKWLLFADCDDFYMNDFITVLDKYNHETNVEIVYFNTCTSSDEGNNIKDAHKTEGQIEVIKYLHRQPWNKMFLRLFILQNNITFEESICGNDMRFALIASYKSKKIKIEHTPLYVYCYNANSITNKKHTIANRYQAFLHNIQRNEFFQYINVKGLNTNHFKFFLSVLSQDGLWFTTKLISYIIVNYKNISTHSRDFIKFL